MKRKKLLSGCLAASVAATAFAGLIITANAAAAGVIIHPADAENDVTLNNADSIWGNGQISFSADTSTLSFTADTELKGLGNSYYGSAFVCPSVSGRDININIPDGVTVSFDNSNASPGYKYGVYMAQTGNVTVTGGGTLILNCNGSGADGYGITSYNETAVFTVDGATVKVNGTYGFYNSGNYNGSLEVTNGGIVELSGEQSAIKGISAVTYDEGTTFKAGSDADKAIETDSLDETSQYIKIETPESKTETPGSTEDKTPTGIRIGGTNLYEESPVWTQDGVTAEYDKSSDTLTLYGTGTVNGPSSEDGYGFGGAIYANKALNIIVAKDADIILNAGVGKSGWSCGIYTYADDASITIGGEGKLTVNSNSDNDYAVAICPYSKTNHNGYDLTLKDSVNVIANGNRYGIYAWQNKYGWIRITDKASLSANGQTKAVTVNDFSEGYIYGGSRSFEGSINGGEWDTAAVTEAKSLSVKPALFTQQTSCAITGSDNMTGFVTKVTGASGVTIKNISWHITSSDGLAKSLTPETQPTITLSDGGQAVFAVLVNNLKDSGAVAYAEIQ